MIKQRVVLADFLLILTAFVWGVGFVAQRAGMQHMGPHTFNALRFAVAALCVLPIARWSHPEQDRPGISRARLWRYGGLAGALLFAAAAFQQAGLVYTTAGKAGFITGLYIVIVPFLGYFLGSRAAKGEWGGAIVAVAGLYFLSITDSFTFAPGDLPVLIGSFFWAAHILWISQVARLASPYRLAFIQFAACAALSAIAALCFETTTIQGIVDAAWIVLFSGAVSVGLGFTLQVVAQRDAPPTHCAVILSLEAVFGALSGWLLLEEILTPRNLFGCVLILAGMLIVQLSAIHQRRNA